MTSPSEANLEILADPEALARRVADWLLAAATAKDGVFAVALSGGSTPRRLYEQLARPSNRDLFPWSSTHWFWGDERFVPHDDALSNHRMVREALLSRAPVPAVNIHPIPTAGLSPEAAASAYERELKSFYGAERLDLRGDGGLGAAARRAANELRRSPHRCCDRRRRSMNLKNMLGQFKANSRGIRQIRDRLSHGRRSFRGLFNDNRLGADLH